MRINQNIMAINARNNLSATETRQGKSLEKLSSGFRINRAGDDAAGLVISEKLRSQVGGLKVAQRNAQDGISVVQTAEGALTESHAILQRMRDLAVQAANGSNDATSIAAIQAEVDELAGALDDIANNTQFNGKDLLNTAANAFTFQVGANTGETLTVTLEDMTADTGLGVSTATTGVTSAGVGIDDATALTVIDAAIAEVSALRGDLGASQNRLEHTIRNLSVTAENLTASESRIRDTDMAAEMMEFTRNQILTQAGTAMLAQANQVPQSVLSLLQ